MNTLTTRRNQSGFTIIELLVVIVVIGILAATTLVAYSGIKERAEGARAASVANAYYKLVSAYKAEFGTYPRLTTVPSTSYYNVCLGTATDYPATSEYSSGECIYSNTQRQSDDFNALFSNYSATIPSVNIPSTDLVDAYGPGYEIYRQRGAWYTSHPANSAAPYGRITYRLKGDQSCPNGQKVTDVNASTGKVAVTECRIWLN